MTLPFELPAWASEFITYLLTGTNIVSFLGIIAALIKIGNGRKESKTITTTQIGLLNGMLDKLSDTRVLAENVHKTSEQMATAITLFEESITAQRGANANLASFVMACFNESNLSAESKTKLQLMADKIFYNDNTKVLDALRAAKAESDKAVLDGLAKIDELTKELEEQKAKLVAAQENVKANRRL